MYFATNPNGSCRRREMIHLMSWVWFCPSATFQTRYRPGIVPGGSLALLRSDTWARERRENAHGKPQARFSPWRHCSRSVAELALDCPSLPVSL